MEPWQELLDYWRAKHIDGRPPARRDIDPVIEIPKLAANLMLADILEDGYRYRLVGSAIVARHNQDLTGQMAGGSRLMRGVRSTLLANYDAVRLEQTPRLMITGPSLIDRAREVNLILPLIDRTGRTEMIVIGVFYDAQFERKGEIADITVSAFEY
jgi:hypothetical protein